MIHDYDRRTAAAKTPADAAKAGYYLEVRGTGTAVEFYLRNQERREVGHVRIRYLNSCASYEVMNSYAREGYGPMLYDVAMEYAGAPGITPDRGDVSADARKIWEFYIRRSDVEKHDLTADANAMNCQFHSDYNEDDWEPLDFRFVAKSRKTIDQLKKLGIWHRK